MRACAVRMMSSTRGTPTHTHTHLRHKTFAYSETCLSVLRKKGAQARRPQLDQELLERVLQKDPPVDAHAKDGSIPKLAEAVVEVFGYKQDVSVLEEPVQKKDTDPVSWRTS